MDDFLSNEKIRSNCSGIICSFHPASFDDDKRDNYIETFFEKVKRLSLLPNTRVNFVAAPLNLKYYNIIKNFCITNNIKLHVDRYAPLKEGLSFTEDERKFAEEIVSIDRKMNIIEPTNNNAVLCSAGKSHIVLFPDGGVWPCLKKAELSQDFLGYVNESNFSLNNKLLKCKYYPECAGCDLDNVTIKMVDSE